MIYSELTDWIADSESWQSHIDYKVIDENQHAREFLSRPGDFYISLMSRLQDALDEYYTEETEESKRDLLAIAKGLEIYSLNNKRDHFQGINYRRNMLYVASLYYLADFSATAILLLKQFSEHDFDGKLEKFLYYLLSRNVSRLQGTLNIYYAKIVTFLRDGDSDVLLSLSEDIEKILQTDETDSRHFVLAFFSRSVIKKFSNCNIWTDLSPFGSKDHWKPFIRYNLGKIPSIWSFFPSQREALTNGLLNFDRAFSLQTPTSSGKTAISEVLIYNEIKKNPLTKILYLAPFRALASELRIGLGRNLNSRLGINVKTIYGGNVVTDQDKMSIDSANVLISTPEKFMAIEVSEPGLLDQFDVVICDEGHLIDDKSRGISYELLLSRLKKSGVNSKRFLFLSAIVPNIQQINSWLGGKEDDVSVSNYRPTEVELAFLNQTSSREFDLQINPHQNAPKKYVVKGFLTELDFVGVSRTINPTTYKAKAVSAGLKSMNSGAVAIFAPTKDDKQGVAGLALEVINQSLSSLPVPLQYADHSAVDELAEYFTLVFGDDYLLTVSSRYGFLFHHGDLPQFVREIIENYIRNEKIKFLICTTTLSEGVNLPIKTLIVKTAKRYNGSIQEPLPLRDLKNLIGRAGRAGKETKGTIIIVTPGEFNIFINVINNEGLEPANGFLSRVVEAIRNYIVRHRIPLSNEMLDLLEQSDIIDNAIVNLLSEDVKVEQLQDEIQVLLQNTFTYFQSSTANQEMLKTIFNLRLEKVRLAVENNQLDRVKKTRIPLRIYESYTSLITFDLEILGTLSDPLDAEWLNFIIDTVFNLNGLKQIITLEYTKEKLTEAIIAWCKGEWYVGIADILGTDITKVLKFMKFIESTFQSHVNSIIRYIEESREDGGLSTSYIVSHWTKYVVLGLNNDLQLTLSDLGISDRLLIWKLSKWLENNNLAIYDEEALKEGIVQNVEFLLDDLKPQLPVISQNNLESFVTRIRFKIN